MGLTDMFSDAADFSGIVKNGKPNKVQMIQKAFIEVNEEGTEAAAATGESSKWCIDYSQRRHFFLYRFVVMLLIKEHSVWFTFFFQDFNEK